MATSLDLNLKLVGKQWVFHWAHKHLHFCRGVNSSQVWNSVILVSLLCFFPFFFLGMEPPAFCNRRGKWQETKHECVSYMLDGGFNRVSQQVRILFWRPLENVPHLGCFFFGSVPGFPKPEREALWSTSFVHSGLP